MIEIYCDGSSTPGRKGPIGWAWVMLRDGEPLYSDHGGGPVGTNNTAELQAAINGLVALESVADKAVRHQENVVLISDSRYVLGMATGKLSAATNLEQIKVLRRLYNDLCTGTRWVRGHAGEVWNERVDSLARRGRMSAAGRSK